MSKPLRLVRVIWEDASIVDDGTWVDRSTTTKPEAIVFDQIGWLMELTSEHVVLSSCVGRTLMGARDRIPAGMVRSIHEYETESGEPVKVPKKRKKNAA